MTREMDATATTPDRDARTSLLLRHCLSLGAVPTRPPARERLDHAIGADLARLLVTSLTARGGR